MLLSGFCIDFPKIQKQWQGKRKSDTKCGNKINPQVFHLCPSAFNDHQNKKDRCCNN